MVKKKLQLNNANLQGGSGEEKYFLLPERKIEKNNNNWSEFWGINDLVCTYLDFLKMKG